MLNKKKIILRYTISVLTILVGTFLMGIAFSVFLSPNNISPTGFSGIASLISNFALSKGVNINPSILYMAMNAILFVIAFKSMGKEFIILSITGVLSFSLSMYVCEFIKLDIGSDLLLCAIYGGVLMGFGAGLVIRSGGSTGGGDTIACMLKHHNAKITQGQVIVAIDAVIITISCFIYGINYGLYALITCFIMGTVCDMVINGVKAARAFYIITDNADELSQELMKNVGRGVTEIKAIGMYQKTEHNMLLCLCSRSQVATLKRTVKDVDPKAFMYSVNVTEALGVGFDPLEKKNNAKTKTTKNGDGLNENSKSDNLNKTEQTLNLNEPEQPSTTNLNETEQQVLPSGSEAVKSNLTSNKLSKDKSNKKGAKNTN